MIKKVNTVLLDKLFPVCYYRIAQGKSFVFIFKKGAAAPERYGCKEKLCRDICLAQQDRYC